LPILQDIEFSITADQILQAQGANPALIRKRKPNLVLTAERALAIGLPLLKPLVLYRELELEKVRHETLILSEGYTLKSQLLTQHLAYAKIIVVILCSIGEKMEKEIASLYDSDPVLGLALDGVGSAAVEALANATCKFFEARAQESKWQASIPLSPGMTSWPVGEGQPEIFHILDPSSIDVRLTSSYLMLPRKSLTMVLGFGPQLMISGTTCSYCAMQETCKYQDHYQESILP